MLDKRPCIESFCQKHPLLLEHLGAVLHYNQTTNLTSVTSRRAGEVLHIEDSLAVLPEVHEAPAGALADLGSGAGYPGIPLALVTGRQTTLIEANKKKGRFLESFVVAHALAASIEISPLRSEELALERGEAFAVVTARAVAELPALLELAAPLLMLQGRFIALKGRPSVEELERGAIAAEKLGMRLCSERYYHLSNVEGGAQAHADKGAQRCVLVYEKHTQPSITLPRRPGMATKRPLA